MNSEEREERKLEMIAGQVVTEGYDPLKLPHNLPNFNFDEDSYDFYGGGATSSTSSGGMGGSGAASGGIGAAHAMMRPQVDLSSFYTSDGRRRQWRMT